MSHPCRGIFTAHRVYCPNTCALSAISAMSKRAKALVGRSQSRMRASGRGLVELGHGRVRSCRPWDRATPVVTQPWLLQRRTCTPDGKQGNMFFR